MKTFLLMLMSSLLISPGIVCGQVADTIYHGGDVVTIDEKNPTAEAVAIQGGKIVAVGKKEDVLKLNGRTTTVRWTRFRVSRQS